MNPARMAALVGTLVVAILAAVLVPAGVALAQEGDGETGAIPDVLRINQSLSISIGRLAGSRTAFLRHEDGVVPSLNPQVDLSGELLLRTTLPGAIRIDVHSVTGDKPSHAFGVAYRDWSFTIGPRQVNFARAGLPYARRTSGAALQYQPASTGGPPVLELIAARTTSRPADVTLTGDDSFGPFFLGHKNIIEESEQIFVDGRLQHRGAGPGDGDYYMDYRGGFIYYNKIVLSHQRIRALFQYEVDDPALSSQFWAALAGYEFAARHDDGANSSAPPPRTPVTVRSFVLRDHLPVDENSILHQSGSTLTAYGARVESTWASGAHMTNAVVATQLEQYAARTVPGTYEFAIIEDEFDYKLPRTPVLYGSERVTASSTVPGAPAETLVRSLDYVINYHTGVITFTFALPPGTRVSVDYEHIADVGHTAAELQGFETRHRLQYRGERWRTTAWVELAGDDYVAVQSLRPPDTKLSVGTTNEYELSDTWVLLGDLTVTERAQRTVYRPAVGAGYSRGPWSGRVRLAGDLTESDGPARSDYSLNGELGWQGFARLGFEFEKDLGPTEGGSGWPEWFKASAVSLLGRLPYSMTYTHGDEHYDEKVEARLTVPVAGEHWRGGVTVASQFLYPDAFADAPRVVHGLFANAAFTGPTGAYVRVQTALAASRFRTTAGDGWTLGLDAGRSLGAGVVVDYQLRFNTGDTRHHTATVEARRTIAHVATVAAALTENISGAVVYRWTDGSRRRADRGATETTEHGLQVSVSARWSETLTTSVTYDQSSTTTTAAVDTGARARRWRLASEYTGEKVSIRVVGEFGLYDDRRQRNTVHVRPAYRLSEYAELWVGYEHVNARDFAELDASYTVHQLKTGVTFRM